MEKAKALGGFDLGKETVLGIVGSPNRDGKTNQLVKAALDGAAAAGARTEIVQMADHVVDACKDCLPWVCQTNLKCTYDDPALEFLAEKILNCGALVLGTPVYWATASAMVGLLTSKMLRIYAASAPLKGLPAVGVAIAGGSGNGLVSGLRPLYHLFYAMHLRALSPVPATRFNFEWALDRSRMRGAELAELAQERKPFSGLEERQVWYDGIPYFILNRGGERRLLADLVAAALGDEVDPEIARRLARANALLVDGRPLDALLEVTRSYEAGIKVFAEKQMPGA
jgi:NAD(P)H-dependent FMN reductase